MHVALLYFEDCPNWQLADQHLRTALTMVGTPGTAIEHRLVSTPEEAEATAFHGSPTVLIDGVDPFTEPDAPVGLACRVYRTEVGPAGAPTVGQLLSALT